MQANLVSMSRLLGACGVDADGWTRDWFMINVPPFGTNFELLLVLEIPKLPGLKEQTVEFSIDGVTQPAYILKPGYHSLVFPCADWPQSVEFEFDKSFDLPAESRSRSCLLETVVITNRSDKPALIFADGKPAFLQNTRIDWGRLNKTSEPRLKFMVDWQRPLRKLREYSERKFGHRRTYWKYRWILKWHLSQSLRKLIPGKKTVLGGYTKILVIRMNHSYSGFFCYFVNVINQLRFAEENNFYPVINFGRWSGDGPNAYFDTIHGLNMWEYYFEPAKDYSYQDILTMIKDPKSELDSTDVFELTSDEIWYLHLYCPKSLYSFAYGCKKYDSDNTTFWDEQIDRAARLLDKYIQVRQPIIDIVNKYCSLYMQKHNVIGIHMRGSDKGFQDENQEILKIIEPDKYMIKIDEYLREHPEARIFVATDQVQFLDQIKVKYGDRVFYREAERSSSGEAVFGRRSDDNSLEIGEQSKYVFNYHKGEEVLVDCLLLARCDYLLRCSSHVSATAMWFNPDLPNVDMNILFR